VENLKSTAHLEERKYGWDDNIKINIKKYFGTL